MSMTTDKRAIYAEDLRDEIASLSVYVTGLRAGRGVLNEFMKQYRDSVLRIIDEQPTIEPAPKWIPVTERLPDNNHPVLVRCVNTTISGGYVTHIGSCDMKKFWFLRTQPGTASFPVQEWQVTHWMPLPEPPKEVQE